MRALHILKLRLRTLFQRNRVDGELDEELQYHLDRQTEQNIQAGMTPREARTAALRLIGGPAQIQEQCRDERGFTWLTDILRDVRYGLRSFRREPVFVLAIVATLGLGIGANTAVFSVADELLLKGLPVRQPEQLFQVLQPDGPGLQEYGDLFAAADYAAMRDRVRPFAQLAADTETRQVTATIDGSQPEALSRGTISANYFSLLGIEAAIGRTISSEDDGAPGQPPVAVISYGYWKRRFNLDQKLPGRTVRIGNNIFQVIGVTQPGFSGIDPGTETDLWTPLASEPPRPRSVHSVRLIGRVNPGATMAQASGPLQAMLHQQMIAMAGHAPPGTPQALIDRILQLKIQLVPADGGVSPFRAGAGRPLLIIFGLVALVLLVACTTVATLFESRRNVRRREMAVRMSLGAGRWRLLRQLLCEALLIAGAAAAFGLILVHWMRPILSNLLTPSGSLQLSGGFDGRVLAFTAALGVLTALLFGLGPAWRSSSVNPIDTLKCGGGRIGRGQSSAGRAMVAIQVAVSLVLVLGASLFVRTLINLYTMNTGFDRHNVILANVEFRGADRGQGLSLAWKELQRRVSAIPGVESASLSSGSPFNGAYGNGMLRIPGIPTNMKNAGTVFFLASEGFFKTAGMTLLKGRDFEQRDFDPTAAPVAVVSESLARQLFPNSNLVGRTFSNFEDNPPRWVTVIGVVKDTKFENLRNLPPRVVYLLFTWPHPIPAMSLVLRANRDAAWLGAALRREAGAANPDFTVRRITTQNQLIDDSLVRERLLATVAGFFGVLALLMSAIGLYGITSYTVTQRTPEIGIRMALGAARGAVLRMILRESALVVTIGAAIGLSLALAAERLVSALLFGATAYDATTIATTILFVLVVTLVAALVPARRASKTNPVVALRYE